MRLDKFICKSTHLTKAEAVQHIYAGEVIVNGIISGTATANAQGDITESTQVHENNIITLNGQRLKSRPFRYILMNKPTGTLCSNTDGDYPSLFNSLSIDPNIEKVSELHIAGRLDVDTTGLVLITDDGRWTCLASSVIKSIVLDYLMGLLIRPSKHLSLSLNMAFNCKVSSNLPYPRY
jgi:16S rRNA pseudouridine516 synthase